MRAVVRLHTLLAIVGVALIATSSHSAPHASHAPQASRGPVRIRATSAGAVPQDDVEHRDTLGTQEPRTDSTVRRRRGPATRHQR